MRLSHKGCSQRHEVKWFYSAASAKSSAPSVVKLSFAIALLIFCSQAYFSQSAPQVEKVEPPGWWAAHSINPVRVLIRGKNFRDARVQAIGAGLTVGPVKINQTGTYLFVDVKIDRQAIPGKRSLKITTSRGSVEVPFEVYAAIDRAGRFQVFSTDDVIYLIMTDRFSDGDPSNNDPPESRGLYDRSRPRYYHGGDFEGVIQHLSYLKELGVTAIWLTPWYDNVNHLNEHEQYPDQPNGPKRKITDYHGYGAVDFYGVEEHFGTLAKLRELVDRAHQLGIKVIQDEVANHTGPYHPWVKDPPTPTWFNGTAQKHLANVWQTWSVRDPHSTPQVQRETLDGWFVDILPDLNPKHALVDRRHRHRCNPSGHFSIRAANFLAPVDGGDQTRVSESQRRRRSSGRRCRAHVLLSGRAPALRWH